MTNVGAKIDLTFSNLPSNCHVIHPLRLVEGFSVIKLKEWCN